LRHLRYDEDFLNSNFNKSNNSQLEFWSKTWGWQDQLIFITKIKKLIKKNVDNTNYLMSPIKLYIPNMFDEFGTKLVSTNIINVIGFFDDSRGIGFDCDCVAKTVRNLGFQVNLMNVNLEKKYNVKTMIKFFQDI
jgi:hypothetical protein